MAPEPRSGEFQTFLSVSLGRLEERIGKHGEEFRQDLASFAGKLDSVNDKLAKLEGDVKVLKDRSDTERDDRRDERWQRLLWGGSGGAGVFGLLEVVRSWLHTGGGR